MEEIWKNSAIITKRNVDDEQNPISVQLSELKYIIDVHSCIVLNQLPDEFHGIYIDGYTEVYDIEKVSINNYKVDYANGVIYFHPNNIGKILNVDYYGIGYTLLSASRIYTKYDKNGGVLETLEELLDKGKLYIEAIETLGGAVEVINELEQDITNGTSLHENLLEDISTGSAVRDDLEEKTNIANTTINSLVSKTQDGNNTVSQLIEKNAIATEKKQALDSSIQSATDTNTTLSNTNQAGTQINLTLQQTIAEASDDIATINATGNKSLIIGASSFTNGEYTWTHSMNNDNLIVSILSTDTNEPIIADYKIIDKNNILIRNSVEHPNLKVILSASYYQGNSVIGSTVEEFLGDSIGTDEDKVRLRGVNGEVQNPVTNSDAVFMTDGVTKLTKKIDDIRSILENKISKNPNIIDVKDYGAKGDGATDDTPAILSAITKLRDGMTLKFPSGEYIVYSNVNGVATGDALALSSCILIKGLKNISIIGELNSIIRPKIQGASVNKYRYPCTLSVDKCENVTINNLTIESRGENYGDADAGYSVAQGDLRTNFVIQNGGSAILVTRSKNVTIEDVKARLCGSCAVIYHSNVSSCKVINCFANALSDGYAGFTTDAFVDVSSPYDNKVDYINCRVYSETLVRNNVQVGLNNISGKCGILIEGDSNPVVSNITGCIIKDCSHNGVDLYLGSGIISTNGKININNTIVDNCNRFAYKRDTLTTNGYINIENCIGKNLRHSGIVIKDLYTIKQTSNNNIINNEIDVLGTLVFPTGDEYLKSMSGICFAEYSETVGKTIISNNIIKIPENGIFQMYRNNIDITRNSIYTKENCLSLFGGGEISVSYNKLKRTGYTESSNTNIYVNTTSKDSAIGTINLSIDNNELVCDNKAHNAISIVSSNVSSLVTLNSFRNNVFNNCCMNANNTNLLPVSFNRYVELYNKDGLAGDYTVLIFDFSNNLGINSGCKIISDDGIIHEMIYQNSSVSEGRHKVTFYINGDIRSNLTNGKYYTLL